MLMKSEPMLQEKLAIKEVHGPRRWTTEEER
jgi:hypothetical protein